MRTVVILALAAVVALVIAVITGSPWPAVAVVALAAAGLLLLVRDWRSAPAAMPPSEAGADQI